MYNCCKCGRLIDLKECSHISSADYGNIQLHMCNEHVFTQMIIDTDVFYSSVVQNWSYNYV